jgi:hypothetical protein
MITSFVPKHKIVGAFPKGRYYYSYIPATKSKFGKLPKQRASKYFASLQKAITDARKRQKARKIIQAQFHKRMGIHDSIVSNLTLSGAIRGGR